MTRDGNDVPEKVTRAYRELGAEEPPPALDNAIRAAARRSSWSWSQRLAGPVSVAAVLVLSAVVTLRIHDEAPEIVKPETRREAPPPVVADAAKPAEAEAAKAVPAARSTSARPAARADVAPRAFPESKPVPAAPAPQLGQENAAGAVAPMASAVPQAAMAKRSELSLSARDAVESPERELERIAQLRAAGRHDEADKALAEFRKRHPDYRIPEAMLPRLERR